MISYGLILDKEYAIPSDNPFVGDNDALPEIWAYGLRNPYRFSFDKVTGKMWVGDVGGAVSILLNCNNMAASKMCARGFFINAMI
jgi:hypothetical protein